MPFSPKSLEEKPYNACLNCANLGKRCDGPNFLAMTVERWCEWCRLRKDYLGWTNVKVSEVSGTSLVTVNRIMSGNVKDLRISTMQEVTKALINGTWGQYPCAMGENDAELLARCNELQNKVDSLSRAHEQDSSTHESDQRKVDFLREQIAFKEEQMRQKDKLLNERYHFLKRKDFIIGILAALLAVCVLLIITALVMDRLNNNIGFFWIGEALSAAKEAASNIFGRA